MKFFSKTFAASLCAAAFTFAAAPQAFAETVTLSDASGPGVSVETVVRTSTWTQDMWVGGQGKHVDATDGSTFTVGSNILAWCLEVALPGGPSPATYDVTVEPTAAWADSLKRLFTMFGSAVNNAVTSAAMQLAIWEVVGGDTTYDLSAGNFQAKAIADTTDPYYGNSAAAISQATSWLNDLAADPTAWNDGYKIVKLTNAAEDHQDLVTFVPTPLPGAALLFLSALGLGGLARRKQSVRGPAAA